MEVYRRSSGLLLLLGLFLLATTLQGVQGEAESEGPSESECRPFIEKALKELETGEPTIGSSETGENEDVPTVEVTEDDSQDHEGDGDNDSNEGQERVESVEESVPEVRLSFFQKIPILSRLFQTFQVKKSEEAASSNESSKDKKDDEQVQEEITSDDNKSDETVTSSDAKDAEIDTVAQDSDKISGVSTEEAESHEARESTEAVDSLQTNVEDDTSTNKEESVEEAQETKEVDENDSKEENVTGEVTEKDSKEETSFERDENEEKQEDEKQEESTGKNESDETTEIFIEETIAAKDSIEFEQHETEAETESKEDDGQGERSQEDPTTKLDEETGQKEVEQSQEETEDNQQTESIEEQRDESKPDSETVDESQEDIDVIKDSKENEQEDTDITESPEDTTDDDKDKENESKDEAADASGEKVQKSEETQEQKTEESLEAELKEGIEELVDTTEDDKENSNEDPSIEEKTDQNSVEKGNKEEEQESIEPEGRPAEDDTAEYAEEGDDDRSIETEKGAPVEDLTLDVELPTELRPREHVEQLLKLDDQSSEKENIINSISEITLKELKRLYENAIKPLEVLYKYRDLSNRHFGDSEIFSKPLILFMGPWSGGKSSIINYLVNNEYNDTSLKTGAEPSPAYFNILMHGDEPEVLDGTQLAADFTFSGLQKFGQGLEERLRGLKLPTKLLEKVNIVEIPGILEVRKQISRVFPFNDACQWFIDRADIIFLVYDPSKLDVGPETEAILDQLKGREHQTRIILNKADQVKPEELLRVQGALIWNISPLMSSPQPPLMYTTSLWSRPYETWAPVRLLHAQERSFLRDLRGAIEKRIENKIASARRFAVRVRNHAKMVDCYLTTYYNHKSVFGNRKQVADEIIEHPQDYHIYEGLSTLTNISRYDLPDPDVYREFFRLNPLYEFQQLSATCTYFRGCPINKLDVAIAYDLPELVGTHKKRLESALSGAASQTTSAPGS